MIDDGPDDTADAFCTKDESAALAQMLYQYYEKNGGCRVEFGSGRAVTIRETSPVWYASGEDWKCAPWPPKRACCRYHLKMFSGNGENFMRDMIEFKLMTQ